MKNALIAPQIIKNSKLDIKEPFVFLSNLKDELFVIMNSIIKKITNY